MASSPAFPSVAMPVHSSVRRLTSASCSENRPAYFVPRRNLSVACRALDTAESMERSTEEAAEQLLRITRALEKGESELLSLKSKLAIAEKSLEHTLVTSTEEIQNARKVYDNKKRLMLSIKQGAKRMRPVQICWLGKAQKVELAGSFDCWNRRYELRPQGAPGNNGERLFVLDMRLYPGQYETKFIVDGEWKIDHSKENRWKDGNCNNIIRVQS